MTLRAQNNFLTVADRHADHPNIKNGTMLVNDLNKFW